MRNYRQLALICCLFFGNLCFGQDNLLRINYNDLIKRGVIQDSLPDSPEPTYINFNPVVPFSSDSIYYEIVSELGELQKASIFTVFQSAREQGESEIWSLDGEDSRISLTTRKATNSERSISYNGAETTIPILHTYSQQYKPKEIIPPAVQRMQLGKFSTDSTSGLSGSLAELWISNKKLGGKKRRQIQSILALKYGITLVDQDYTSSKGKGLWKIENHAEHRYHIAGIGRDDELGLYQKQAVSVSPGNVLTVGLKEIAATNFENEQTLDDQQFLIWSDNNADLTRETEQRAANANRPRLMQRSWKVTPTGDNSRSLETILHFDVGELFDDRYEAEKYFLIIDRSGSGQFAPKDVSYIQPSGIEGEVLVFESIIWDQDGSGNDVFTLTLDTELELALEEVDALGCDNQEGASVKYMASGGIRPFVYEWYHEGALKLSWDSGDEFPNSEVDSLARGTYELVATDLFGRTIQSSIEITGPTPVQVELGEDINLLYDIDTEITPEIISDPSDQLVYAWVGDNGFVSTNETITVDQPGIYTLTVTSNWGCSATDTIEVLNSFIEVLSVYPTFSDDGVYKVNIGLADEGDVKLEVFGTAGDLISQTEVTDQSSYELQGYIEPIPGLYFLVLSIGEEQITHKLMIE